MTTITRAVYDQIDASHIQTMAQQLGISSEQAQTAVQQALPMLVGGLSSGYGVDAWAPGRGGEASDG